jgi:NAD-dependent SIR2 family protein deacetylase
MAKWHGKMVAAGQFVDPEKVVECETKARPEYHDIPAHEYRDSPEVVKAKIKLLAQLLRQSKNCVAYTGAGLSVSSGLADYATKSSSVEERQTVDSRYHAQPNVGHKVLARLHKHGFVKRLFNQNHDGLLQKAGLPQGAVNEIHGAFFDPSNPGGFDLREDLVEDMFQWADRTDLCLALGTSLSGLNADRIARNPAKKYSKQKGCHGLVIVALQETQLDELATLRIFALLDDVLQLLAEELKLPDVAPVSLTCSSETSDVFIELPYDCAGQFSPGASLTLDLRLGAGIKVTNGNFAECPGKVVGKNKEGHYLLKVTMDVGEGACIEEDLLLASWWLLEAESGRISTLPVVQAS